MQNYIIHTVFRITKTRKKIPLLRFVCQKGVVAAFFIAAEMFTAYEVQAQRTYGEMEQQTANKQVTTVITAYEPIRMVDISTIRIAGDIL